MVRNLEQTLHKGSFTNNQSVRETITNATGPGKCILKLDWKTHSMSIKMVSKNLTNIKCWLRRRTTKVSNIPNGDIKIYNYLEEREVFYKIKHTSIL